MTLCPELVVQVASALPEASLPSLCAMVCSCRAWRCALRASTAACAAFVRSPLPPHEDAEAVLARWWAARAARWRLERGLPPAAGHTLRRDARGGAAAARVLALASVPLDGRDDALVSGGWDGPCATRWRLARDGVPRPLTRLDADGTSRGGEAADDRARDDAEEPRAARAALAEGDPLPTRRWTRAVAIARDRGGRALLAAVSEDGAVVVADALSSAPGAREEVPLFARPTTAKVRCAAFSPASRSGSGGDEDLQLWCGLDSGDVDRWRLRAGAGEPGARPPRPRFAGTTHAHASALSSCAPARSESRALLVTASLAGEIAVHEAPRAAERTARDRHLPCFARRARAFAINTVAVADDADGAALAHRLARDWREGTPWEGRSAQAPASSHAALGARPAAGALALIAAGDRAHVCLMLCAWDAQLWWDRTLETSTAMSVPWWRQRDLDTRAWWGDRGRPDISCVRYARSVMIAAAGDGANCAVAVVRIARDERGAGVGDSPLWTVAPLRVLGGIVGHCFDLAITSTSIVAAAEGGPGETGGCEGLDGALHVWDFGAAFYSQAMQSAARVS